MNAIRQFGVWLVMGAWLMLTFSAALAQDVVLLIDNSGSMKKNDPQSLTKQAVARFLQNADPGMRVAVIIFDQGVKVLSPLTAVDENARLNMLANLDRINFKGLWTNSGDGLQRALDELKTHRDPARDQFIVFLTDGIVDTGRQARDLQMMDTMRGKMAKEAAESRVRIFALAFTENADEELLVDLADATSGAYFQPLTAEELPDLFGQMDAAFAERHASLEPQTSTEASLPRAPTATSITPESAVSTERAVETPSLPTATEEAQKIPPAQVGTEEFSTPSLEPSTSAVDGEKWPLVPPEHVTEAPAETAPVSAGEASQPAVAASASSTNILVVSVAGLAVLFSGISIWFMYRISKAPAGAPIAAPRTAGWPRAGHHVQRAVLYSGSSRESQESPVQLPTGEVFELTGKTTLIGRVPGLGGIAIADSGISRQHAAIEYRDYTYWVIDQGSSNGTFVNGKRVAGTHRLNHGDRLRFHERECLFLMPGRDSAAETMIIQIGREGEKDHANEEDLTINETDSPGSWGLVGGLDTGTSHASGDRQSGSRGN
ncbi:MAG: VWA domain-containing protein [Gammaproteobacteria bacterium]